MKKKPAANPATSAERGPGPGNDLDRKHRSSALGLGSNAPRAEPSRRGAKRWVGGRRNRKKGLGG